VKGLPFGCVAVMEYNIKKTIDNLILSTLKITP
jgi:hypothetical protein